MYPAMPYRSLPGHTGGSTGVGGGAAGDYALGASGSESKLSGVGRHITVTQEQVGEELRLAGGRLVQDLAATKSRWAFSYVALPGDDGDVTDSGLGRDSIVGLYRSGSSLCLFVPLEDGTRGVYTVRFVQGSLKEARRLRSPHWAWDIEFALAEV